MTHDKKTFTAEYCRCRRIPYKFINEGLYIKGYQVCFSIYNLSYNEIVSMIDNEVVYNEIGFFERLEFI